MKGLFGIVGLLLALALVAMLVKRQMAALHPPPAVAAPAAKPGDVPALPTGSPQNQVDQVKQTVDQLMKARPMPDGQ